ncbi:hypothetical protein [Marininema halotolerans]|uniref:Uncharacterized protein n=1 Tax=Marininema halotolerans TaxID=1155944 RepID=A0A1I6RFQ1_9BACL|nr:hypothetical protein [Marininema halotolerans]SFS63400.1 hypothetical protein SAMN05444972_10552 [Marininema halotolerans]
MVTAHSMPYAEYQRSLENRMKVEEAREADYRKAKRLATESGV